jgi:hypothetical protein
MQLLVFEMRQNQIKFSDFSIIGCKLKILSRFKFSDYRRGLIDNWIYWIPLELQCITLYNLLQ